MEKRLFYLYLKYIEESCPSVWKRLGKITPNLKWYLGLMITFYVTSIGSLVSIKYLNGFWSLVAAGLSIIFVILCIIFGVLLFLGTEKYEIDISDQSMKEYWDYCYGVRGWFRRDFLTSKRTENDIDHDLQEVKKRLDHHLKIHAKAIDKRNERVDKWIQALAIPFILAVITSILEKSEKTIAAISEILTILLILAVIIGVIWVINSIAKLFKKQKHEQMKCFSEDLQGAIDCVIYAEPSKNQKEE